ncbi:MAG: sigma-54-dependent Fis family transcriptional regulator [Deltaproteobacteria bacterium]|nr:sigma-54-dependent Fis family transcriptional regulator [Deltaproteobacteria bacterium]
MLKEQKNKSDTHEDSQARHDDLDDFAMFLPGLCHVSKCDSAVNDLLSKIKNQAPHEAQAEITAWVCSHGPAVCKDGEFFSLHMLGRYYLCKKKYAEAIQSLEQAMFKARAAEDGLAFALAGFDSVKACVSKHRWSEVYNTLLEIEHIYQEHDLVDEKIYVMIHLADFYRKFGGLEKAQKILNTAFNLHSNFTELSEYTNKTAHYISLKMAQALTEKKKKDLTLAIDTANALLPLIEEHTTTLDETQQRVFLAGIHAILGECYLETGNREKSFANLNHIKKNLSRHEHQILRKRYNLLKAEHELFFERKTPQAEVWTDNSSFLWSAGDVEFCLDQVFRVLGRCHHENTLENNEKLIDYYRSLLDTLSKKLPRDLVKDFVDFYEFKHATSIKLSSNNRIKKFIDFCRVLICERDTEALSKKSLELVLDYTKMERGFVLLFDSTSPRITATHQIAKKILENKSAPESSCINLAKAVLKSSHSFIKTCGYHHDLFQIWLNEEEHIKRINRDEFVILPLMVGGDGIGLIYVDNQDSKSLVQDMSEVEVLENLAGVMAYAINNTYQVTARESDLQSVKKLLDKHKNELETQKYSYENFIGVSEKKRELFQTLQKSIDSTATITLSGESGVGKELVAKMIHYNGQRKMENFVALNCAAIPENLLESELFGYVKGSFTGADDNKDGLFVTADKGTLFLDEIGEMPLSMQVKLIRVLQEREVSPIGGAASRKIDVRIICATNRDLESMVKEGEFREDLFYRINVVNITVPSLRERREDIPLIVDHALRMYAIENAVPQKTISTQAMKFLMMYPWPGNVRELINVMYNLSIFVEGSVIELNDLEDRKELFRSPIDMHTAQGEENTDLNNLSNAIDEQQITLSEAKSEFERLQIERALKLYNGQITSASYHLQMPRPQVSRLVKKYNLKEGAGRE